MNDDDMARRRAEMEEMMNVGWIKFQRDHPWAQMERELFNTAFLLGFKACVEDIMRERV